MRTFYINASVSCLRTKTYAQKVYNYLTMNGFTFGKDPGKADLIIIDTCAYCKEKQDASIEIIRLLTGEKRPGAKVIIIGCLPGIDAGSIAKLGDFYSVSSNELDRMDGIINAKFKFSSIPMPLTITLGDSSCNIAVSKPLSRRLIEEFKLIGTLPLKAYFKSLFRFIGNNIVRKKSGNRYKGTDTGLIEYHVNVGKGCLGNCSYCAIKFVWGRMQSRPLDDVLKDFEECVKINAEAKIISLETQDLGAYGLDINSTVVRLLNALFRVEGKYKVALHDLNVNWLIKYYSDLEGILADNADRIHYINVNIQSGNDKILESMRRPYRIDDARRAVINLKSKLPNVLIFSDIMVGFPGETDEDFEKTKQFVREIMSCGVSIWRTPYSDRPGTEASKMENKISQNIIDSRCRELYLLQKDYPGAILA